ncbi:MAG: hypothetical protein CK424_07050 [Legionella sp.]|nr:MAG: hypothetical protein CK424_07050 [Legionella sp.]
MRVSTDDQNLDLQIDELTQDGCYKNDIYKDKVSGEKTDRPGLIFANVIYNPDKQQLLIKKCFVCTNLQEIKTRNRI